ncbi:unnamed protein product, partial [Ostreobium quekettii]
MTTSEAHVLVVGIIGGTFKEGRLLLSQLLDYDFELGSLGPSLESQPHVKGCPLMEGLVYGYLDSATNTLYLQLCAFDPLRVPGARSAPPGPPTRRSSQEASLRWMLAALVTFLSCHMVLVLQRGPTLDVTLLHKFRNLQVIKDALGPFVSSALGPAQDPHHASQNARMARGTQREGRTPLLPGHCIPWAMFIFQDDHPSEWPADDNPEVCGEPNRRGRTDPAQIVQERLTRSVHELLKGCKVPAAAPTARPLFTTQMSMLCAVVWGLRRQHADDNWGEIFGESWGEGCEEGQEPGGPKSKGTDRILWAMRKRRDAIRAAEGQEWLAHLPQASGVLRAWQRLQMALLIAASRVAAAVPLMEADQIRPVPSPPPKDAGPEEVQKCLEDSVAWLMGCIDPMAAMSGKLCLEAKAKAKGRYLKMVPELYTRAVHERALQSAVDHYNASARGPASGQLLDQLRSECAEEWRSGRQRCERHSLTGRPCVRALRPILSHVPDGHEGEGAKHIYEVSLSCPHSTNCEFRHASASGAIRRQRGDPFTFLDANVTFYADCASDELASQSSTLTATPHHAQ